MEGKSLVLDNQVLSKKLFESQGSLDIWRGVESEQPLWLPVTPVAQLGRHTSLLYLCWTKRVGNCDEERPKLVGQKPGTSSCSQNALARCQLSSVPKLISLPGARTSLLGWKTRLMVLGWLQHSSRNCIALLCRVKLLPQWGNQLPFSSRKHRNLWHWNRDMFRCKCCPTPLLVCCGSKRENKGITTSFPSGCWGYYCNFNIPLVTRGGGPASCGDSISLWDAGTMHVIDLILASGKGKLKQFPKELLPAYIHCPWTADCDWLIFSTHKGPTTAFLGLLELSWVLVFAEPPQKSILFPPKQWHLNLLWAGSALSQKNSSFPNITKCLDSSGGADTGLLVCEHSNGWCGKNRDTNILTRNLFGWKDVSLVTPNPAVK